MKKMVNVLSWVSFFIVNLVMATTSLYVGAMACNYLSDHLGLTGWQCLLLVPVMFLVSLAAELFFMLGANKVRMS